VITLSKLIQESTVSVPINRSIKAREDIPRYFYHNVQSRGFNKSGGIDAYPIVPREKELLDMYKGNKNGNKVIYLSRKPFGSIAVKVDLKKLDLDEIRSTGQAEGHIIYRGNIPAKAITK
jgi:hypothetical protein